MSKFLKVSLPMDAGRNEMQIVPAIKAKVSTKIELSPGVAYNHTLSDDTTFIDITNGGLEMCMLLFGVGASDSTGGFTYGIPMFNVRNNAITEDTGREISFYSTNGTTIYLSEF